MTDEIAIKLYQSISEDNEPRIFERWHSSSIADCPRAHYFKRLGIPSINKPTGAKILRWDAGHILEEKIRPHIEKLWPDVQSNVRTESEEWDLTGEYDNYSAEAKTIIEIKSVGPRAIRYKKAGEDRFHLRDDGPYLNHILQNHSYSLLPGVDAETITFIYITLEGLIATYVVSIKEMYLNNVKSRLTLLNESWKNQTPPDCICTPDHPLWGCTMQYCDYRSNGDCCSLDLISKGEKS